MMNKGAFKGILRKGLAFGMVGAMALSIAACGGKSAASSTTPATEAPAATTEAAPATTESTAAGTVTESSAAGTATEAPAATESAIDVSRGSPLSIVFFKDL